VVLHSLRFGVAFAGCFHYALGRPYLCLGRLQDRVALGLPHLPGWAFVSQSGSLAGTITFWRASSSSRNARRCSFSSASHVALAREDPGSSRSPLGCPGRVDRRMSRELRAKPGPEFVWEPAPAPPPRPLPAMIIDEAGYIPLEPEAANLFVQAQCQALFRLAEMDGHDQVLTDLDIWRPGGARDRVVG
jgi:hypothetical protein